MGRREKIFHAGNCFQILKLLWSPSHGAGLDWTTESRQEIKCGSEEAHGIEGLPGVRRSVKHPAQIQVHQTFQQIQVGVTFKPLLEIWKQA